MRGATPRVTLQPGQRRSHPKEVRRPPEPCACPLRARSDGEQRCITVADGHAISALNCNAPGQGERADELLSSRSQVRVLPGALPHRSRSEDK